jgi:MFS transporter, putative metabolite:H+ symporter
LRDRAPPPRFALLRSLRESGSIWEPWAAHGDRRMREVMESTPSASAPGPGAHAAPTLPAGRYLWLLFGLLMSATIFEGYDITIFHLCTPDIARTFQMSDRALGLVATVVRFGGLLSFFIVVLADVVGRRPIVSVTVIAYAALTLLTGLSRGMASFTVFQSAAQIFLAAEFGVAVTMIGEEFPDSARGRAIAGLHTVAFLGVAAAGFLYRYVALSQFGWRAMYLIGVAPLLLIALLRRGLRETVRFSALEDARRAAGQSREPLVSRLRRGLGEFAGPYRSRLLLIASLWNTIGLVGGPTITFFSLYAQRERHWTPAQVGIAIVVAYLAGSAGSLLSGWSMDRLGRRTTACALYLASSAAMLVLFQAGRYATVLFGEIATMFAYQASRTATSTLSTELFPTEIRATSFSLAVQVIGQIGWVLSPILVGALSRPMGGLGNAASIFAAGPIAGALIVLAYVPETRGRTLEELAAPQPSWN